MNIIFMRIMDIMEERNIYSDSFISPNIKNIKQSLK